MPAKHLHYASLLQQCARSKSLLHGKHLHCELVKNGYGGSTLVANSLIQMYGSCGLLDEARQVFDTMCGRNVYSWTIMLVAYGQNGDLQHAKVAFDKMPARSLTSCNALISAYVHSGLAWDAIALFQKMCLQGEKPDSLTFVSLIDSCAALGDLALGTSLRDAVVESGFSCHRSVANTLINMYGKCHRLPEAWAVFQEMPEPDVISWTSMITAFAQNGHFDRAIALFRQMPVEKNLVCWAAMITAAVQSGHKREAFKIFQAMDIEGSKPSTLIFVSVIDSCSNRAEGRAIHTAIEHEILALDVIVFNALLSMYSRTGDPLEAWCLFRSMPRKDPISYNSIATACLRCGEIEKSRWVLERMPQWEVASWNLLLCGYAQTGNSLRAIRCILRMNLEGIMPDRATFIAAIDSCRSPEMLSHAQMIHRSILNSDFRKDLRLLNATIDMYGKCKAVDLAEKTFHELRNGFRDSSESWAQMIACCAQNGEPKTALRLFKQMNLEGVRGNALCYLGATAACSEIASLAEGKMIHACFLSSAVAAKEDALLGNALIDMYGKCGNLKDAQLVFQSMLRSNQTLTVVSWTALIAASASNRDAKSTMDVFREMQLQGIAPNGVTLTAILSAFSHFGLLHEALRCFSFILQDYGMQPAFDHFASVVDLLGRAGELREAQEISGTMPFVPDLSAWLP